MQNLLATSSNPIWSYFSTICSIPHPSKHEQQLVDWVTKWAAEKSINCTQDEIGNLILTKPASSGYEEKTPVILQAHLDMVPQKNSDSSHDFLTDPITPIVKGEWLHADNTTLGADNGIGMASCLAVLADNSLQHGPLEVLLTTDEETGMTGAFGLQAGALKGRILINTDSEQEGELYVGCAGGINVNVDLPYEKMEPEVDCAAYEISLTGLKGGHSGCDINLGRANAIKELAGVLDNIDGVPFFISRFEGGSLRNAIPREAKAVIVCDPQYQNSLELLINTLQVTIAAKYQDIEENLTLSVKTTDLPQSILTHDSQTALLSSILNCKNGVFNMDSNFSDVVQTSSNIGVITQTTDNNLNFQIQVLIRSQVEQEKLQQANEIQAHFEQFAAVVRQDGNYPGWTPNPESAIYKVMEAQYIALFSEKPKTMVIHAGLECGLFSDNYPDWDMISVGPTIKFPHSPDEKVEIATVDKYWKLLTTTLKALD
ncbi:cytosol nonspecific dipeptidase [Psychromonas sp. psych-6C06]|uniref:aminoacyl-histidine dipeptidase n=1 Tax=Psychromonas sp. psych-6C06 TaxID=2058089 RepID=UPI000C347A8E|nr:aminoacyl-histidine dipeptidase [Psychromonas sp. psych-6C06]PKF62597.1 cytosol nonspecific dipeptidase [Psychromonas sp. psych-6C06]